MEVCKHTLFTALLTSSLCFFSHTICAQPNAPTPQTNIYPHYYSPDSYYQGFTLGAGVDYMKFSNNGTLYAMTPNRHFNIDTDYHAGFNLKAGYRFPGRDTLFNLDYMHLHTSDSARANAPGLAIPVGEADLGPFNGVSSKVSFDYDSVNLTAGHAINFSRDFGVFFYGGLNYTHLARDMRTWTTNSFDLSTSVAAGTNFNGVGPTFGMDGYCHPFYDRLPELSVIGGLNSSLLYGTMSGYVRTDEGGFLNSDHIPNENIVVPALGGKLALDYGIPMQGYKLNAQLGYQAVQYFNVTRESNYINNNNASFQGFFFNILGSF